MTEPEFADLLDRCRRLVVSGQPEVAHRLLASAPEAATSHPEYLFLRGVAAQQVHHLEEAEKHYQRLLDGHPEAATAWKNLAIIYYDQDRYDEVADALRHYREWAAFDREALGWETFALTERRRFDEATTLVEEFATVFPYDDSVVQAKSYLLGQRRQLLQALFLGCRGYKSGWVSHLVAETCLVAGSHLGEGQLFGHIHPQVFPVADDAVSPSSWHFQADFALISGDPFQAVKLYERYFSAEGKAPQVVFNMALALLSSGDFANGWAWYRERPAQMKTRVLADVPEWNGEPLAGKRLLVNSEQGLGDVIQFLRYLPDLQRTGAQVVMSTYSDLLGLLKQDASAQQSVVDPDKDLSGFDYQVQMIDVPGLLLPTGDPGFFRPHPYLEVTLAKTESWRKRLAACPGPRIGLVWAGNPQHENDLFRSAAFADLAPLAALPGVTWVVVQKGAASKEAGCNKALLPVMDLSDEIEDFADTAGILNNLDLLISVDTSVVHLAGALGRPAWLMLPARGEDWRWKVDAEYSRWYPSVRLWRQAQTADWTGLLESQILPRLAKWLRDKVPDAPAWQKVLWASISGSEVGDADVLGWAADVLNRGRAEDALRSLVALPDKHMASRLASSLNMIGDPPARHSSAFRGLEWLSSSDDGEPPSADGEWPLFLAVQILDRLRKLGLHQSASELAGNYRIRYPDETSLLCALASEAARQGQANQAIEVYERVLQTDRRCLDALLGLAGSIERSDFARALDLYQRALGIAPRDSAIWLSVARLAVNHHAPKLTEAIVSSIPDLVANPVAQSSLGVALAMLGRGDEVRALIAANPQVRQGNWADTYECLRDADAAASAFRQRVEDSPARWGSAFSVAAHLLRTGHYGEGWRWYERMIDLASESMATDVPLWQGEPLEGKRLLIYQDQGYGDLVQFVSLVRQLPGGAAITLAVNPEAVSLLAGQAGWEVVRRSPAEFFAARDYDYRIGVMRLASRLAPHLSKPAPQFPYLVVPEGLLPEWQHRCQEDRRFKVGLVWAGNPNYANDFNRSSQLTDWLPLTTVPGVGFYNLQKDAASNQALVCPEFAFENIAASCSGMLETASAISMLDLVIAVDTGLAHLAASIGKETWLLLPRGVTDFRWGWDGERIGWYPTLRVFRNPDGDQWKDVMLRIAAALEARVKEAVGGSVGN